MLNCPRIQNIIMHGSSERLSLTSRTRQAIVQRNKRFEGIVNQMARRYQDTESGLYGNNWRNISPLQYALSVMAHAFVRQRAMCALAPIPYLTG